GGGGREAGRRPLRGEAHPCPGREQRGRLPVGVEQRGVAAPDQLPAAGGGARVDAAVAGGEADGADGHRGARLGAARDLPRRTAPNPPNAAAQIVPLCAAISAWTLIPSRSATSARSSPS